MIKEQLLSSMTGVLNKSLCELHELNTQLSSGVIIKGHVYLASDGRSSNDMLNGKLYALDYPVVGALCWKTNGGNSRHHC